VKTKFGSHKTKVLHILMKLKRVLEKRQAGKL